MTKEAKFLSREDILDKTDVVTEVVHVPAWGGDVCVKSLSSYERDRFEKEIMDTRQKTPVVKDNVRARFVAKVTVHSPSDLSPLFSPADVELLGKKNAGALSAVYDVGARLSGITESDVDELVGNSNGTQEDSSTSI